MSASGSIRCGSHRGPVSLVFSGPWLGALERCVVSGRGDGIVITLTTKAATPLVERELETRSRQLGLFSVQNESGTVEVQATTDEIEDFEREGNPPIESDVIPDGLMRRLADYLTEEELF